MSEHTPVRLNKYLSEIGYCSRRVADKLIEAGRITVNGEAVVMGLKVTPADAIAIDGEKIKDPNHTPCLLYTSDAADE